MISKKYLSSVGLLTVAVCAVCSFCFPAGTAGTVGTANNADTAGTEREDGSIPKIVNIVNFIRLLEPRDAAITQDVLYQTVVKQIEIMKKYKLGGTFLLQYDALMEPRYQKLLKGLSKEYEIGAWWEIPQPLAEKAGMKWRGRYPWDWHAHVGFSTGYTPKEREKIIDVYMDDFKKIFGYYPKSAGSWFIDAHSLLYMHEKYNIIASSNCKDQYGTDGYTLWGGYWNQAYYPSKINSYMPAQHEENQIPVPIFRMLGSDPIRQYDLGAGTSSQGVITLEPVYKFGGGDAAWVNWFFDSFVSDKSLGFNYAQTGQENSFTWEGMAKGFEIQMPLIARLRKEGKIRVETMAASGLWFKKNFKLTPTTSFSVDKDIAGSNFKTVWFNSRFYRINLLWENNTLRIRDIHVFDENFPSAYETVPVTSNECSFFTLPVVDGFRWSNSRQLAGLRLKGMVEGKEVMVEGGAPAFTPRTASGLRISWPLKNAAGTFEIDLDEKQIAMRLINSKMSQWYLELHVGEKAALPFGQMSANRMECKFEGMSYSLKAVKGNFSKPENEAVFRINPQSNVIALTFANE